MSPLVKLISASPLALLALLVAATLPSTAGACPNPDNFCNTLDFWGGLEPVNAAKIATDGVVVLAGTHHVGQDPIDWAQELELTVTLEGQPVAGTLTATALPGVMTWRPAAPWVAGATYQLAGTLQNPPFEFEECAAPQLDIAADLVIDDQPAAALGPSELTADLKTETTVDVTLENLACCPGAAPSLQQGACGAEEVLWDSTLCAPTVTHGYAITTVTGEPATTGPAAAQVAYTLVVDGTVYSRGLERSFNLYTDAPFCAVLEAIDLGSGATSTSPERCFAEDLTDILGVHPLDPHDKLDCPLQQCAVVGDTWNPSMCTPYGPTDAPTTSDTSSDSDADASSSSDAGSDSSSSDGGTNEQDGEKGCACDLRSPPGPAGPLALLGLLTIVRRRRAR